MLTSCNHSFYPATFLPRILLQWYLLRPELSKGLRRITWTQQTSTVARFHKWLHSSFVRVHVLVSPSWSGPKQPNLVEVNCKSTVRKLSDQRAGVPRQGHEHHVHKGTQHYGHVLSVHQDQFEIRRVCLSAPNSTWHREGQQHVRRDRTIMVQKGPKEFVLSLRAIRGDLHQTAGHHVVDHDNEFGPCSE